MARNKKKGGRGVAGIPRPILVLLAVLAVVALYRVIGPGTAHAQQHPQPRQGISAERIVPAERYAAQPEVERVYRLARRAPQVLDGIYCYCHCSKHSGHYSLLTCYESDHGAGCEICLGEAALAVQLHEQGKTLDQIRAQIDATYGS
ncbi:MAG: hypothetical protein HY703_08855 [Gemmatimonadetes bacterium]|nr:hypothetical protein [Gemmatimonadota bacterium]